MNKNTRIFNKLQSEKNLAAKAQKAGRLDKVNRHVASINHCRTKLKAAGCNSRNTETARQLSFVADNLADAKKYIMAEAEKQAQGKKTRSSTRKLDDFCEGFKGKLMRAKMPTYHKTLRKLVERVERNRTYEPKKAGSGVRSNTRTNSALLAISLNEFPDGRINVTADYVDENEDPEEV